MSKMNERDVYPCCGRTESELHGVGDKECEVRVLRAENASLRARVSLLADFLLSGNRIPFHWKGSPGGYFCAWCDAPWRRDHYPECAMGKAIDAALSPAVPVTPERKP